MGEGSNRLVIVGAGGLGIEVLWAARLMGGWGELGFVDDDPDRTGPVVGGVPVLGNTEEVAERFGRDARFLVAVGSNRLRQQLARRLLAQGLQPATLIHPAARLAPDASVGAGSYLASGVTLAPLSAIGNHVLVNTNAVIGHECRIGDFSQICPGAIVTGRCRLGEGSYVGSNAALHPGTEVGDWGCVGACSFVTTQVEPGQTVLGNPARPVFQRK
jgi:acetyltransferase EpsM